MNRFNSAFQFIRPTRRQEQNREDLVAPGEQLHIDTNPLGISYNANDRSETYPDEYYSEIFRQLNYPHDKKRPSHQSPTTTHREQHEQQQQQHPPSLSPTPSPTPTSSTSSGAASPSFQEIPSVGIRQVPHSKCQLNRRKSSVTSPTSLSVSATSWEHMKSPAASFLAAFASPPNVSPTQEEDGDEIDDYVLEKIIGYGGFSTVRSGYRVSDGRRVAVKIIQKYNMDEEQMEQLERELSIWKSLEHPNIVSIEKVLETDHAMYIVCTYCGGGSLLELVNRQCGLPEKDARKIIRQLCDAIHYLHKDMRVCHRDIKLDNVLLDDDGNVKLCDFGLALHQTPTTPLSPSYEELVAGGSPEYVSPEQIMSRKPLASPSVDMWSLGVLLYGTLVGQLPFRDNFEPRLQQKIIKGEYERPLHLSAESQTLLGRLLQVSPKDRCSVEDVLNSSWMTASL